MNQFTIDHIAAPLTITLPTINPKAPQRFGISMKDHDAVSIDGRIVKLPAVVRPVQVGKDSWEWWIAEGADDDGLLGHAGDDELAGFEPLAR